MSPIVEWILSLRSDSERSRASQVSSQSVSQQEQGRQQQESKKKQTRSKEFKLKKETCYPHLIPLRTWLAHREGEEGMRKLGEKGLDKVEEAFLRRNSCLLYTSDAADE